MTLTRAPAASPSVARVAAGGLNNAAVTAARLAAASAALTVLALVASGALFATLALGLVPASAAASAAPATLPRFASRSKLVASVVLFFASSALAAAETAITALYPWKVRGLAHAEGERSPFAMLDRDITRFLTTILVASTLCGVYSTALATDVATRVFGSAGVGYATGMMTVVFLFLGEILPKTLAVHNSEKVARATVPPLHVLSLLLYPIGRAFSALVNATLSACGLEHEAEPLVSENELRLITAGARRSGGINVYEQDMIESVLDLEETEVREIMEPRVEMTCVEASATLREFMALERQTRYSRFPVFADNVDNIVGVLYVKKMLEYLELPASALESTPVSELMDPAIFVPESMAVWRALEEMRKRRIHMCVVVDEYGGTAGLVTLEDIVETILGELYDEDDEIERKEHEREIVKSEGGGGGGDSDSGGGGVVDGDGVGDEDGSDGRPRWWLDGQAELEKAVKALALKLPNEDMREYGTIGGLLCDRMGGIPDEGDTVLIGDIRFTVEHADDRRILKVRAEQLDEAELAALAQSEDDSDNEDDESGGDDGGGDDDRIDTAVIPNERPSDDRERGDQSAASRRGSGGKFSR